MTFPFSWLGKFIQPKYTDMARIRDEHDRIILMHGVNVSNFAKQSASNRAGLTWHTEDEYRLLLKYGFNAVRYLVFWEALEPQKSQFDTEYLRKVAEDITRITSAGLLVMVDMHQDIYTQAYGGDGFPIWTMKPEGGAFVAQKYWAANLLQPAVKNCYKNFWADSDMQDRYIFALDMLVRTLQVIPGVIGFDIMNEPYPHDLWKFSKFEQTILTKFYGKVQRIGANRLFFEPWMSTSSGIPSDLAFKPTRKAACAPHYYDIFLDAGKPYKWFNKALLEKAVAIKVQEANQLGAPLVYGEFGLDPSVPRAMEFLQDFNNELGKYGVGWFYWSYDKACHSGFGLLDNAGKPRENMKILGTICPTYIAGEKPSFFTKGGVFRMTYEAKVIENYPTITLIPEHFSGIIIKVNGLEVKRMDRGGTWEYSGTGPTTIEISYTR